MTRSTSRVRLALPLAFAIAIISFVSATLYGHYRLSRIDEAALLIGDNAAPSIERLADVHAHIQQLHVLLRDSEDPETPPSDADAMRAEVRQLEASVTNYFAVPALPGEEVFWSQLKVSLVQVRREVERVLSVERAPHAQAVLRHRVSEARLALDEMTQALVLAVEFDARQAMQLATDVRSIHGSARSIVLALDGLSVLVSLLAAFYLSRILRRDKELTESYNLALGERAAELDAFAGRVAHDLRSPLSTLSLVLNLLERAPDPEKRTELIGRGQRTLARAGQLIEGLLLFARSGARPEPGARADVEEVLRTIEPELRDAATRAGIELVVDWQAPAATSCACEAGVLTSIVQNLVMNAIKHMGDAVLRQITVRVGKRERAFRFEVQDTGPGIPPDLLPRIFEPFFRASGAGPGGVGLGLATIRRLAEGHGGRVGVSSEPGRGSTFWFELPSA